MQTAAEDKDARYAALIEGHNNLVNAFNSNMAGIRDAMQHLELRINAVRHVIDDIVANDLTLLKEGDEGFDPAKPTVHWLGYHHVALQKMKEELDAIKAAEEAAQSLAGAPDFMSPTGGQPQSEPEADVVFGG